MPKPIDVRALSPEEIAEALVLLEAHLSLASMQPQSAADKLCAPRLRNALALASTMAAMLAEGPVQDNNLWTMYQFPTPEEP
jgi:hypothetical protein